MDRDNGTTQRLRPVLAGEGWQVEYALPGRETLRRILLEHPDLIILGINQGEKDWHFCRQVVVLLEQPLLCLLASGDELSQVRCLDLGADDCLSKPVPVLELVARIRALLRRKTPVDTGHRQDVYMDGGLTVNLSRRQVRLDGESIFLTAVEFRMLACFVRYAGVPLSSEFLMAELWGSQSPKEYRLVKQYVYRLRKKIERNPHRPQRLVTERGMGYRLQALDRP